MQSFKASSWFVDLSLASPVQCLYSVDNTLLEKKKQTNILNVLFLVDIASIPSYVCKNVPSSHLVGAMKLYWAQLGSLIPYDLNWKLKLKKMGSSPCSLPWIFSKMCHETKPGIDSMRLSSTGNNSKNRNNKNQKEEFMNQWANVSLKYPHVSSPDYEKPLQLQYALAMFGYSKMKPPKTFSMPSNISKRGFCFKKALPCQAKRKQQASEGVACRWPCESL